MILNAWNDQIHYMLNYSTLLCADEALTEVNLEQEPGAMHKESCNKLQWAHIKTANRIIGLEEEDP